MPQFEVLVGGVLGDVEETVLLVEELLVEFLEGRFVSVTFEVVGTHHYFQDMAIDNFAKSA